MTIISLVRPLVRRWDDLLPDILAPMRLPRHPLIEARFGMSAIQPVELLAHRFKGDHARALLAGVGAHSMQPLDAAGTSAIGLVLMAAAHRPGWPIPRGGSRSIANALAAYLLDLGGTIETDVPVASLDALPQARAVLLDISPNQVAAIARDQLPARYRRALESFEYGPGVFKVDWALSEPVPWTSPRCREAGTLHLGASLDEIVRGEREACDGVLPRTPMVLVAQPSVFDDSRAPAGKHTLWGYCHVPSGSTVSMLDRIEAQIERFAPGFRDVVLARHVMNTADLEARNPNIVGGDIGQGANTLRQLFFRPTVRLNPHSTPVRGLYLCSSSTPPGGGVHGMCGLHAARSALRDVFGVATDDVGRVRVA